MIKGASDDAFLRMPIAFSNRATSLSVTMSVGSNLNAGRSCFTLRETREVVLSLDRNSQWPPAFPSESEEETDPSDEEDSFYEV